MFKLLITKKEISLALKIERKEQKETSKLRIWIKIIVTIGIPVATFIIRILLWIK